MDDRKVFELKRLELAYIKQMIFMAGVITLALLGLILYIYNVYQYNFQLLIISIVLVIVGIRGIFTIDQHMKDISREIKGL
jgi:uncharacterized membrane protein YqjE